MDRMIFGYALHNDGVYGRLVRKNPLLKERHKSSCSEFATSHLGDSGNMGMRVLRRDDPLKKMNVVKNTLWYYEFNIPSVKDMVAVSCSGDT